LVADDTEAPSNVIALDSAKAMVRSLNRAANMLDAAACDQILANSMSSKGVVWTWENLIIPVLTSVGLKWEQTGEGIEIEHLLAESIMGQFRRVTAELTDAENARPVILACAPHELHTIPIYAIAAGLAEHKIATRVLGARMPGDALANAVKKLGPSAVVIWSQTQGTADLTLWDEIGTLRPNPLRMSAGPGWIEELPEGVVTCPDFTSTLITLAAAAGR
jgi:methanogenic corrinoid protein MtbC1